MNSSLFGCPIRSALCRIEAKSIVNHYTIGSSIFNIKHASFLFSKGDTSSISSFLCSKARNIRWRDIDLQDLTSNLVIPTFYMSHLFTKKNYSSTTAHETRSHEAVFFLWFVNWWRLFQVPYIRISWPVNWKIQDWYLWWSTDSTTHLRWIFPRDNVLTWKRCLFIIQMPCQKISWKYKSKELLPNSLETIEEQKKKKKKKKKKNTRLQHKHQVACFVYPFW